MLDLIRRVTMKKTAKAANGGFKAGDTVEVSVKIREGEKERIQLYKGVVLKISGAGASRSFTVRKISNGIGVERTFPFESPAIDKIRVVATGTVRRSRLFYLRNLEGKAARIDSELISTGKDEPKATPETPTTPAQ